MNNIENRAICFWSWNNGIDEKKICRQLHDFADGRIEGVVIHARAGLTIPYLSNRWMDLFSFAVEKAAENNLEVWIYDEQGWPSGFAAGKIPALGPEYCHQELLYVRRDECSSFNIADEDIIAIYIPKGTDYVLADCRHKRDFPDGALIFYKRTDSHYVDLLNPLVTEKFVEFVHEKYYEKLKSHFGNTIKGFFTDEPQLNNKGLPWSDSLENGYLLHTGRQLLNDLWLLAIEGEGFQRVRTDFWNTVSDLFHNAFTKQLSAWCDAHHVALTGHFAAEDGLCEQIPSNGGVMRNYRAFQLPGIDHLGSRVASPVLMKQASSASRQYGTGMVLSETFGCSGWAVDFRRLEWIWGGQSVLGITKPCYHLSAYSIEGSRKRDYPPFFSKQELWWDDFKYFASRMKNINQMMTQGSREVQTLILSPKHSICAWYQDFRHDQTLINLVSGQFRMLVEYLLDLQLDFDLSDPDLFVNDVRIADRQMQIGNIQYKTVFLAYAPLISEELDRKLKEINQKGLTVFVANHMPKVLLSDGTIRNASFTGYVIVNRRDTLEKHIEYLHISRPAMVVDRETMKPVSGVRLHIRNLQKGKRIHIWPQESFADGNYDILVSNAVSAYEINPTDRSERLLNSVAVKDGLLIPVHIRKQENLFIETRDSSADSLPAQVGRGISGPVRNIDVSLCEPNCLTIDRASLSFDNGKTYEEERPVIKLIESIYEKCNGDKKRVVLKYVFFCKDVPDGKVTLAFEDVSCRCATINGMALPVVSEERWLDDCIGEYDVTSFVRQGENTFLITYDIAGEKTDMDLKNIFETEQNRFFYPIEPDSVYLRGNFDVVPQNKITRNGYSLQTSGFVVTTPTIKKMGDVTHNGAWFYRGNIQYTLSDIEQMPGKRTYICMDGYDGALVIIHVNGREMLSLSHTPEFDVTDDLKAKDNQITVELVGTNRNLLGPHHHICGEIPLIGPATFEGRHEELTDFMVPCAMKEDLWTDEYGFVPFGIHDIYVKWK